MRKSPASVFAARTPTLVSAGMAMVLACAVLLPLLGHRALAEWDEGIYAEVSREMLTGGWLVPHWNGTVWMEKPPLMLWVTAGFFKVFGVSEFWARAGSALAGVATVGLLHGWLVRGGEGLAAWFNTIFLLGTMGFLHLSHMGEMDLLLTLGCCLSLIGLQKVDEKDTAGWYWFWGGLAVAVMTKGAASVVLVLTGVVAPVLFRRGAGRFRADFWLGLVGFLVVTLPWHLYMLLHFGRAFLVEYLGLHVLARATHQIEGHVTHWWYYAWVLIASAMPFVLLYPAALIDGWRRGRLRVWVVFAVVVLVFFSAVQTRLPHYIAPAYPALTLLTAVFVSERVRAWGEQQRSRAVWARMVIGALAIYLVGIGATTPLRKALHSATLSDGTVLPENKDSIALLRRVFREPQEPGGPLLLWRQGRIMSIATDVFYSRRQVRQVQPWPVAAGAMRDKYYYDPETFEEALGHGPRLILLDRSLVARIPSEFRYRKLGEEKTVEIGVIERAEPAVLPTNRIER